MVSLQFITHQTDRYTYFESALMALEGGCKWIQLRMKEAPCEEVEAVALQLKPLCKEKEAILLLDDHVELAKKLEVDGVHLGKKDMPIDQARQLDVYKRQTQRHYGSGTGFFQSFAEHRVGLAIG